jgi:hypothetical protein
MGVNPGADRLDRPEFVAKARGMLGISEVVTTAEGTTSNTGDYTGHGVSGVSLRFRRKQFVEHGSLLGFIACRPRNQMRKCIPRLITSSVKDDYFQQELARDTQVAATLKEVYSEAGTPDAIIGYTARDEWLRSATDVIASDMMDSAQEPWTASREFSTDPSLKDIQTVPEYPFLYQDTNSPNLFVYAAHAIGKRSIVPRRTR